MSLRAKQRSYTGSSGHNNVVSPTSPQSGDPIGTRHGLSIFPTPSLHQTRNATVGPGMEPDRLSYDHRRCTCSNRQAAFTSTLSRPISLKPMLAAPPSLIRIAIGGQNVISGNTTDTRRTVTPPTTTVTMSAKGGSATGDHVIISRTLGSKVTYWDDPIGLGNTRTYELVRDFCTASSTSTSLPTTAILAHDLPANQGQAVIACGPSIPANMCTPNYLSTNWLYLVPNGAINPIDGVTNVSLSVSEPLSAYQFNLSATPRYSNPAGNGAQSGGSPVPSLLLLGNNPPVAPLLVAQNTSINVTGQLAFNYYRSQ